MQYSCSPLALSTWKRENQHHQRMKNAFAVEGALFFTSGSCPANDKFRNFDAENRICMRLKRLPFIKKYGSKKEALRDVARQLWLHRRTMLRACGAGLLVGIVVVMSIPREYEVQVRAVPERRSYMVQNALSDADVEEVTTAGSQQVTDALRPTLYPKIVRSVPFLLSMADVQVSPTIDGVKTQMPLSEYMREHHRRPWWGYVMALPRQAAGLLLSPFRSSEKDETDEGPEAAGTDGRMQGDSIATPDNEQTNGLPSAFRLTRRQMGTLALIARQISVDLDVKRGIIILEVRMQDADVAAAVADSMNLCLQKYVTTYRLRKERQNLQHVETIYEQAQADYYCTQEAYARYADANRNPSGQTGRAELVKLRTEVQLAYRNYVRQSAQLQVARMRAYRERPVYAVIEPARVPVSPAFPRRGLTLVAWTLVGALAGVVRCLTRGWANCGVNKQSSE